jgi:hypothetical protein
MSRLQISRRTHWRMMHKLARYMHPGDDRILPLDIAVVVVAALWIIVIVGKVYGLK